jgi:hypothetical protein
MKLYEFQSLTRENQVEALWHLGVSVSEREDEKYLYVLYSLDSFYVELKYCGDMLIHIGGFKNTEALDPYISTIAIPLPAYK